jgi:hypothetical protein
MSWAEAEINLRENIHLNDRLDGFGHYKIVTEVPDANKDTFRIKVGKSNFINVNMLMLHAVFEGSLVNNNIYNGKVFKDLFPLEHYNKPCYVHAIGKLFVRAGIAIILNSRSYRIQ